MRALIKTLDGDALGTTRGILEQLWRSAKIEKMLIPLWEPDQGGVEPTLIEEPTALNGADPFSPLLRTNSAKRAMQLLEAEPNGRLALTLRPCELRTLTALSELNHVQLGDALLISCDCLSLYHPADIDWRVDAGADWETHTREALHFAPQGGILPSRYRVSCQICERPTPRGAHIHFELLGLETRKHIVLGIYDPSIAQDLDLSPWGAEQPDPEIDAQRERVLENLRVWRHRAVYRLVQRLPPEVSSLKALNTHLKTCRDCRSRLEEWCPAYVAGSETDQTYAEGGTMDAWLQSCGGCGLCEYDCPLGYPLFEVMIARQHGHHSSPA